MGEIADMMLDGTLDEETGEYIGEINKEVFGSESPGFPVSYERNRRERGDPRKFEWDEDEEPKPNKAKTQCPHCKKWVSPQGLADHIKAKHE